MFRSLLAFVASAFLVTTALAEEWSVEAMNSAIDETNFLVNSGCSGTLIDLKNKYILTAAHCVDAQYETVEREVIDDKGIVTKEKYRKLIDGSVTQFVFDGAESTRTTRYRVALKAVDRDVDLAVVQVVGSLPNTKYAKLADSEPRRGERVYVVGNPAAVLYASVVVGIVSSVQRTYGLLGIDEAPHERLMQISAGVIGGNSGGSVYNSAGELVGVPVRGSRVNEILGFAVPLDVIKAFLSKNRLVEDVKDNSITVP
jgi:S1-C subfamily serine protease